MGWINEKKVNLLVHYINVIFICSVLDVVYSISKFNYIYVTFIYAATVAVYWIVDGLITRKLFKFIFFLIIFSIAALYLHYNIIKVQLWLNDNILGSINRINECLANGKNTYFTDFAAPISVVLPIIVLMLFYLYGKRFTESVLVLNLAIFLFFWYLQYYNAVGKCLVPFVTVSLLTFILNSYYKNGKNFDKKGIRKNINGFAITINTILFSFIVGIAGSFLPQQSSMIDRFSILNRFTKSSIFYTNEPLVKSKNSKYGIDYSGYNNTEKMLGGPIRLDTRLAFQVKGNKILYLKGDVKDKYTGYSWKKTIEDYEKENDITEYYNDNYDNGAYKNLFTNDKISEITIYPAGLKSSSFMVPIYTTSVQREDDEINSDIYHNTVDNTFLSTKLIVRPYNVKFFSVDINGASEFNNAVISESNKIYLELPDTITQRTIDLVYNITKGSRNNGEKIEKIRKYLSENYQYTLEAPELPKGDDFVDFFLFEEKKGYCVHFATAMTVMYRIAGIPARFVEGYKMSDKIKNGYYEVTNDQAHAWCEYIVSGSIWSISDASPTAYQYREEKKNSEINVNIPVVPQIQKQSTQTHEKNIEEDNSTPTKKVNSEKELLSYTIVLVIGILIVCLVIFYWINSINKKKKVMLYGDSYLPLYRYVIKRLRKYGITKDEKNTDIEFINSLEWEVKNILYPLAEKVYEEFYGGIKDNKIEKKLIYSKFEQYLKKRGSIFIYYLKKSL